MREAIALIFGTHASSTSNGKNVNVEASPDTPLLWVLRDHLGLTGTKFGCGAALRGACTGGGGKVASFDASVAEKRPGVRKVVNTGLKIEWDQGPAAKLDTAAIDTTLENAKSSPEFAIVKNVGDASAVLPRAKTMEAVYHMQMLAHATLEPPNCLARVGTDGPVDVWASTRYPQAAQAGAAKAAGVKPAQVHIHPQFIGGGFGRRLDVDYLPQAVLVAKALPGTPVKLIWTREDGTTHDFYRAPRVHLLRAALDGDAVVYFTHTMISPSITQRLFAADAVKDGIDDFMVEGVKNLTYEIPNLLMRTILQEVGMRVGYWRLVWNANNAGPSKSFLDELAHAANKDPLALRLSMLEKLPRQRAVLERVARDAGYSATPSKGSAVGLASMECYTTFVAVAAAVSGSGDEVKLEKLCIAADCGIAVHPDQVVAQLEGGVVTGLINAIRSKVMVKNGRVEQTNFHDFPIPRINEVPPITVAHIVSKEKPGGMGEVGVPLVAPAIGNAVFTLTDGGINFV